MAHSKSWLWAEIILFFIGLPTLIYILPFKFMIFVTLWLLTVICLFILIKHHQFSYKNLWSVREIKWRFIKRILAIFLVNAVLLTLFTLWHDPERLYGLVQERTGLWLMIMLLYPILSAYPQEIIYRSFFFERYGHLFNNERLLIVFNGLLFGYAHIFFNNWIAISFSTIGGFLFAYTYQKHRSLLLVSIEHALYGCYIFTAGLGLYFYKIH